MVRPSPYHPLSQQTKLDLSLAVLAKRCAFASKNGFFRVRVEGYTKEKIIPLCSSCGRGDSYAMFNVISTSVFDTLISEIVFLRYFFTSRHSPLFITFAMRLHSPIEYISVLATLYILRTTKFIN